MILLIDNYDSFTYNLYQQLESLGTKTLVKTHDEINLEDIKKLNPSKIIISPGPKTPNDSGICIPAIKKFHTKTPILGVCLGHQCIGQLFGSKVIEAKTITHGKTSKITHNKKNLFKNIKNNTKVARYHSLAIDKIPKNFTLTAWTNDKEIMGIKHNKYPLFGIQFHTESFMTEEGDQIIQNFLNVK